MSGRIAIYMVLIFAFLTFGGLSFIQKFAMQIPSKEISLSDSTFENPLSILKIEEKKSEEFKSEELHEERAVKPHVTQNEMKLIRSCYGIAGIDHSKARTLLFFGASEGTPHIITSRILKSGESENNLEYATMAFSDVHQEMLKKNGVLAIHGTLSEVKASDEKLNEHQFDALIDEATQLCMGEEAFNPSQSREIEKFQNELMNAATAFIQLDTNLEKENSKILVYYELNGIIHTFEWSPASKAI